VRHRLRCMTDRIERLRVLLEEPLLVTSAPNVFYLTGFRSTNAAVLVGPEHVTLYSDFRYAEAARTVPGVEFVETKRTLIADLSERLSGKLAFEADALTYSGYEALTAGGIELVPRRGLVERLRAVKSAEELDAIRRATALTNELFERLSRERFIGRRERDVAWRIRELVHDLGADDVAFPPIVAAGPNGATPHAQSGDTRIEAGQTVVVDAACMLDAYNSDCTRTFATGPLPDELKEAYRVCVRGQQAGLDALEPGARGRDVDAVARRRIEEAGYGKAFGHGLGHGVGLVVHEAPRLAPTAADDEALAVGNVVTVEPGIYLSGLGGIRIEDLVIVGEDGPEVLTTFPKDLIEVG
jgi:Xaa-Pro aminopeptidase